MKKVKHLSFRIEEELLRRFQYVAEYDGRSANGQLLFLVRQCIAEFEKEHGKIKLKDN